MLNLILNRVLWAIPLLLGVSLLTFFMLNVGGGDIARTILGESASPDAVAALREQLGLDNPWWVQYGNWLAGAVRGDLGTSILSKQPVTELLNQRLGPTLSLAILGTLVSTVLGVGLGVLAATRGRVTGGIVDVIAMLGFAIPNFWLALMLVAVFAVGLRLFPATGYVPISDDPVQWAWYLVLPVAALALGGFTLIAKQSRDAMLDALSRDYVDALRADGWSEGRIVFRHALRNASVPVLTAVGVFFVAMLGGAVFIETVFALPGLGRLAVTSTQVNDVPIVLGVTMYFCIGTLIASLLVDLAYGWLNPKVRVS